MELVLGRAWFVVFTSLRIKLNILADHGSRRVYIPSIFLVLSRTVHISSSRMAPPKLYTHKESGNSYKVSLLAALLSIELEEIEVDVLNNGTHTPEFLAISPRGHIPVLVDGDKTFRDSAAILVYLAGTHPGPGSSKTPSSFWSNDVVEQAAIIDWLAFTSTFIANGVSLARAIVTFKGVSESTKQPLNDARKKGKQSLEILQATLSKSEWLCLGRLTIADVAAFVYVALAPMGDVSLDPYPAVKSWIARIRNLPDFIPIQGLDDPFYRKRP
jgi:glutathione S-transferase